MSYRGDIHTHDEANDVKSPTARSPRQRIGSSLHTLTGSTPWFLYSNQPAKTRSPGQSKDDGE